MSTLQASSRVMPPDSEAPAELPPPALACARWYLDAAWACLYAATKERPRMREPVTKAVKTKRCAWREGLC